MASVFGYIAKMLKAENDEHMNRTLVDFPTDAPLCETRKIMHRDVHRQ
jgi:hypothetical protein